MVSTVFAAELNRNVYDMEKTTLSKVRDQESNGE